MRPARPPVSNAIFEQLATGRRRIDFWSGAASFDVGDVAFVPNGHEVIGTQINGDGFVVDEQGVGHGDLAAPTAKPNVYVNGEYMTQPPRLRFLTRTVFLINAGLDVLYIAGGAALMGLGKSDFVKGSGAGVILQGSFLLLFDGAMGVAIR